MYDYAHTSNNSRFRWLEHLGHFNILFEFYKFIKLCTSVKNNKYNYLYNTYYNIDKKNFKTRKITDVFFKITQ